MRKVSFSWLVFDRRNSTRFSFGDRLLWMIKSFFNLQTPLLFILYFYLFFYLWLTLLLSAIWPWPNYVHWGNGTQLNINSAKKLNSASDHCTTGKFCLHNSSFYNYFKYAVIFKMSPLSPLCLSLQIIKGLMLILQSCIYSWLNIWIDRCVHANQ